MRILTLLLLTLFTSASAATLSDEEIVANAFPESLQTGKGVHGRWWNFAAADLNHSGETVLVAVYTNGTRAAVQVVSRSGRILAASQVKALKGDRSEIELADLDHDGTPEIIVHLYAGHGANRPDTWVFAWRDSALTLVSPMQVVHGNEITLLGQTAAIDVTGDGPIQLLAFPGTVYGDNGSPLPGNTLAYTFANGALQQSPVAYAYVERFRRRPQAPDIMSDTFAATAGSATLHIVQGSVPVTSGRITLNGHTVASPDDFKANVHAFAVPVSLAAQNTLSVELGGQPGASVLLLVESPAKPLG